MKFAAALLSLSFVALTCPSYAATAGKPPRYFRQHSTAAKPRAAGDPVVVNAASYLPGVSPGGLATIFGQNLSSVNGIVFAGVNPLPLELAGVSVYVNGTSAPIFGVAYSGGQDQISIQVPYETPTGLGAAAIQVYNGGILVGSIIADSFTEDPGIFLYNGNYAIAVHGADNTLIGPNDPAAPGETIVVYATGLGPLTQNLLDGYGAPSDPLAYTIDPFTVLVNGESARVLFSGLGPGFVGLDQLNIIVPIDAPSGNLDLQITSPYANSGIATLPVL